MRVLTTQAWSNTGEGDFSKRFDNLNGTMPVHRSPERRTSKSRWLRGPVVPPAGAISAWAFKLTSKSPLGRGIYQWLFAKEYEA